MFSDIWDEEIINASQDVESISRLLKPLNQQDLDKLIRSGLSKKTEAKCKRALNLFRTMRRNNQMHDEEIYRCLSYFVAEVKNTSGEDYKPNTVYI